MKKRLISLLLTVAMLLTLVVVPTNAALVEGTGILTITPNVTSVPGSASAPIEVIYTIKVTPPAEGPVGEFHFNLKAPDGMTLSEVKLKPQAGNKGGDGYWVNMNDLWYNPTTEEGVFETFEYTPASKYFQAFGTSASRNMTAEADIMTIKATIAAGKVGDFTLTAENVGINKDGTDSYSVDVKTTPVTVVSSISGNLSVAIAKPVVNQAPVTTLTDTRYSGTITWDPAVTSGGKFAASTVYTANVTLTARDGYQFANGVSPTVTDATISDKSVSADGKTLTFKAKFDATDRLPAASVKAAPTAMTGLKYNGNDQALVSKGTATGGTMQYRLDNTTWSTAIPKGKDAKTYTVYYMVKGGSDYTPASNTVSVTIGPKSIADSTVTIDPIPDQTYTGNAITPDPKVKDGTTPLVKGTDYTVSYTKNKYVGTNTAKLTITGTGNYTGTTTANFTIVAADQNPTFTTPVDLVKGGQLNLRTLVQGAKGDVTFAIAPGTTSASLSGYTLTATGIKGEVKVSVSITAKDVDGDGTNEYNAFSKSEAITVNVVDKTINTATMKVSQSDIIYGGSVSPSVTNKPDGTGTVSYTYEGRDGTTYSNSAAPTNVGKYKVKATCESSTTIYTAEANFAIQPKSISGMTVTLDKTSLEYNGSAQTVNVTSVGSLTAADYTVTSGKSGTDVNSYTVTVTGKGNYTNTAKATWQITPATLTVTPKANQSKKFNEADPALTYTFSGNASGQTPAFNGKLDREAGENVGTYAIKLGDLALKDDGTFKASNYTLKLSSTTVKFEIKKADAPAAPTGLKGVQNNELATVVLPTGWEWEASNTKMDTLGSHTFKAKYTDTTGNYNNAANVDVTVEVLAKTGVSTNITFPNGKLVYNGHGQEYKNATISGIIAGDTPSWTYTYTVDPSTATATLDATTGLPLTVGKYKVTAIYEDSANYGTAIATLEITPAKPTGTPTFTKITEKGKTLADANLGMGTLTPTGGTLEWVDGNATVVEANKAYKWRYTPAPADAVNYAPVTGTIVVYPVSTGIVIYSPCYTIKASAGVNGTISPAGWCSVVENGSQTFTFTPDKGYTVAKVLVDGKSVGAVKSYTFKNVTKDHTIEVIFMKSNGNPATGVFVMP